VHFEHWNDQQFPFLALPLVAAAVPAYVIEARKHGMSIGFWWFGLFLALSVGIISQMFYTQFEVEHALAIAAIASAFTLVPWLHPGRDLRTQPWVAVGGTALLILFFVLSSHRAWGEREWDPDIWNDIVPIVCCMLVGIAAYALSITRRKPLEAWPYPEAFLLLLVCYGLARVEPLIASITMNLTLLAMGAIMVRTGITTDSLRRMNLGLALLGMTVLLRFFDREMSFLVRGIAFILVGAGFLVMNLRMFQQRKQRDGQ
jgi:hypothetical protein